MSGVKAGRSWEQGQERREGEGRWVACSVCTAVLVFVTSRHAAVESGPELSRGGGSRELLPRGQQWGGGSSGQIFLLLLLLSLVLFLLFLQLTSLLLFLSRGTLLLFSSSPQVWPEKVVAGFGEMRAAAAPWWCPGPCALWPPSLTPADSTGYSCRKTGSMFQQRKHYKE